MIGANDIDWYKITVPASTTGTMVVRMQSTNLSLLAPTLAVYNAAGTTMLGQQISYNMGDTVTVTITNVSAGQVYDIRCQGSTTGDSGFGAYGLQVNFGSLTQPPVTAPDTTMAEAADQGGGTMSEYDGRRRDRRRSSPGRDARSPVSRRSGSTTTTNRPSARTTGSSVPSRATVDGPVRCRRLDHGCHASSRRQHPD